MNNFALGFGSTEAAFERDEEAALREFVTDRYEASGLGFFSNELAEEIREWLNNRSQGLRAKADEYKTAADHPDRYSTYHASVAQCASDIVAIFRFTHINRRHALSPDGWGAMQTTKLVHVSSIDLDDVVNWRTANAR